MRNSFYVFPDMNKAVIHTQNPDKQFECHPKSNRILTAFRKRSYPEPVFEFESAPLMIDPVVQKSASIEVVPKKGWIQVSEDDFKYDYKVPDGHVIIGYKKEGQDIYYKCAAVLVDGTPLDTIYETTITSSNGWIHGYALDVVKQVLTGMVYETSGYGRFLFYKGNRK